MTLTSRSMTASEQLAVRALEVMPGPHSNLPGYELFKPIWITRGSGAHLWDVDGNEYFDYMCGLGAGTMGYGNKVVVEAVHAQLDRLPYLDAARRNPTETCWPRRSSSTSRVRRRSGTSCPEPRQSSW